MSTAPPGRSPADDSPAEDSSAGVLERAAELAVIQEALRSAASGSGRVLVIEGQAGIGKSTLLGLAKDLARRTGLQVGSAQGAALERELSHGIARQLLEPFIARADPVRRDALLSGAAGLASPVVLPTAGAGSDADQRSPVVHGLYWLTANLTTDGPVLLTVDDAQWCDSASLRYLDYLTRRLDGLPVVLLIGVRPGETDPGALDELRAAPGVRSVRPAPLTDAAVDQLIRRAMPGEPAAQFVDACRQATGGVPYLLNELLGGLAAAGMSPTSTAASSVAEITSGTVGHATLLRLSRLSPDAVTVAQSVAILGRHATPPRVARLSGLADSAVLLCVDVLVAARILRDSRPLGFVHPIVLGSVYDETPSGARRIAHAAAAAMLAAEGENAEEVATHLLRSEPGTETAYLLRPAAAQAISRGAPESAISYLRRLLEENLTTDIRAGVLHELGRAESVVRDGRAAQHLAEAMRLCTDPEQRATIAVDLVQTLMFAGLWDQALSAADQSVTDLAGAGPELTAHLQVFRAGMMSNDPRLVDRFEADRPQLTRLAASTDRAGRLMAALLASAAVCRAEPARDVEGLAAHGLAGDLMIGPDADAWGPQAAGALAYVDRLDEAAQAAETMLAAARLRGSVYGFVRATGLRALVHGRRGDLASVEADLRAAFEQARGHQLAFSVPPLLFWSLDALLERPGLADIVAVTETLDLDPGLHQSFSGGWLLEVRGRLRAAAGQTAPAVADLEHAGALMDRLHTHNPTVSGWRSALALALAGSEPDRARQLATTELELARAAGLSRTIGIALRTNGLLCSGDLAAQLLAESAQALAQVPLELARTRLALGRALRRSGHRALADPEFRAALDLAHRCGADRLAQSAEQELRAIGARPRRRASSGVQALTPSEARVAAQAAAGMSNRDIAQALFVTAKTVENQLSRVYLKLGIRGREELADHLG